MCASVQWPCCERRAEAHPHSMRAIADASQVDRSTCLMRRRCRRDPHELNRAFADASQVARATCLARRRWRRDCHELMHATADASQVARATCLMRRRWRCAGAPQVARASFLQHMFLEAYRCALPRGAHACSAIRSQIRGRAYVPSNSRYIWLRRVAMRCD